MSLTARKTILRSAEHVQNLARSIPAAVASGVFMTFLDPLDAAQPTVDAKDVGHISAELLLRDQAGDVEIVHVEGPRRYSASETASIIGELTGRAIEARFVPREDWQRTLERQMPPSLARLLVKTNEAKNDGGLIEVESASAVLKRGTTDLADALRSLVSQSSPI